MQRSEGHSPFPQFQEAGPAPKRNGLGCFRLQQQQEIEVIKRRLAREEISCDAATLERAVLMPEEQDCDLLERKYPRIECNLMINPFPKEKKKKKKKKGKR